MEDNACVVSLQDDGDESSTKAVAAPNDGRTSKDDKGQKLASNENVDGPDSDIQTLMMALQNSGTELIVLDESGSEENEEDEEGELKSSADSVIADCDTFRRDDDSPKAAAELAKATDDEAAVIETSRVQVVDREHDSDIEIVSGGQTSDSVDSEDSVTSHSELNVNGDIRVDKYCCPGFNCPFKKQLKISKKRYRLLKREFKRLRRSTRALHSKKTGIDVKFRDETLATKYGNIIDHFISNLLKDRGAEHSVENEITSTAGCSVPMLCESFYIDKYGQNEHALTSVQTSLFLRDDLQSPACTSATRKMEKESRKRRDLHHTMADCSLPKDNQRISQNRTDYMSKRQNLNSPRYHVEDNLEGKFAPGKISNNLRHALGLKRNELPIHIYKMRVIGYPPGWLKETEIHDSGLMLYDSDGKAQDIASNKDQDSVSQSNRVRQDPLKLVEFPGFNVAPPEDIKDDWKELGFPPMQEFQMKHYVEKIMKNAHPNKRKSDSNEETTESSLKRLKASVMDVEESMDVEECASDGETNGASESEVQLIATSSSNEIPVKNDASVEGSSASRIAVDDTTPSVGSPSLEDLESAKEKLISALGSNSCDVENVTRSTPVESSAIFSANSKAMCLGSPAIYQASCFKSLPGADKFASGVSEHLNFENLPDSTGTFEKMREVLKGIRQSLPQSKV